MTKAKAPRARSGKALNVNVRRAVIAGILGVFAAAAAAPLPGACNTYVRDDLNLLRADTFAGVQRRNADLISRTGACIDVITVVSAGPDLGKYAYNTAMAFGNNCSLGAVILITQSAGDMIRFEDASAGIRNDWQSISQDFGNGMARGDTSGAVMTTVNAIADGIIAHPAPSPPPTVYASPPPAPSVGDAISEFFATSWASTGGRIAIICVWVLAIILLARAMGLGRRS